jgi:hypothetical protein
MYSTASKKTRLDANFSGVRRQTQHSPGGMFWNVLECLHLCMGLHQHTHETSTSGRSVVTSEFQCRLRSFVVSPYNEKVAKLA